MISDPCLPHSFVSPLAPCSGHLVIPSTLQTPSPRGLCTCSFNSWLLQTSTLLPKGLASPSEIVRATTVMEFYFHHTTCHHLKLSRLSREFVFCVPPSPLGCTLLVAVLKDLFCLIHCLFRAQILAHSRTSINNVLKASPSNLSRVTQKVSELGLRLRFMHQCSSSAVTNIQAWL